MDVTPVNKNFSLVVDAEKEFERAWENPNYTQIELKGVSINEILAAHYELERSVHFTRDMLWDVEVKKAWDPGAYIPYVVKEGKSWGGSGTGKAHEVFVRSSKQRLWLDGTRFGEVFEKVFLNHSQQRATFLGVEELEDTDGKTVHVRAKQPLFHVQHSVGGDEDHPTNEWRIVHLTDKKSKELEEAISALENLSRLPGFVEIYIQRDLQTQFQYR